jgi:hypothetical protein
MTGREPLARFRQPRRTPAAFVLLAAACAPSASQRIVGDRPHDTADTADTATPADAADPWLSPIDYEALCVDHWPTNECDDGGCADTELEARYEAAFWAYASQRTGLSVDALADQLRLRRVVTSAAKYSSLTEYQFVVRRGWSQIPVSLTVPGLGGDPSEAEILDLLVDMGVFPEPGWGEPVRPLEEVEAAIDRCEVTMSVDFPETDWCNGHVTTVPDEDDPRLYHTFWAFRPGPDDNAMLYAYPGAEEAEPSACGTEIVWR